MFAPGDAVAWHEMTAVRPARRGRGLATTLKRATIAWAIGHGLEALETGNDEANAPMRAVNARLGYHPLPDVIGLQGPRRRRPDAARHTSTVTIDLNGIRLRNRLLTSASLLGYGASKRRLILYGLSPIAQWVPLERFGAVTTRTLTLEPRPGHFTLKEDWSLREFPEMLRLYGKALHRVDAGWLNAFGWSNIGIGRYFDEYFDRTARLNRIVSVGGFSADEIEQLFETVNERAKPGEIAAIELNASCHNVNFPFETILEDSLRRAVRKSRHPVILKVSPDEDYRWQARLAESTAARRSPRSTPSRGCGSTPRPASRT